MKLRGNQKICAADVLSYESLVKRWRTQRALKTWWQKHLDEPGKVAWYRKHQQERSNNKRQFDDVGYVESSTRDEEVRPGEVEMHIPWPIFKRHKIMEGYDAVAAAREFAHIVNNQ